MSLYLGWILNLINVRYRVKIFEVWKRPLWVVNSQLKEDIIFNNSLSA
jgi:hypothetical protein